MALWSNVLRLHTLQRPASSLACRVAAVPPPLRALSSGRVLRAATAQHEEDHVKHWNAERLLSVGLLGVVPAAFLLQSPAMDYALALSLVVHSHWGVEAIVVDYVRPKLFGETVPKLAIGLTYFLSAFMLGGLFYFNYTDVGLVQAIKMFWKSA